MSKPFARAIMMMASIAAAMSHASVVEQRAAMDKIGPYVSRGKGQGGGNRSAAGAGMAHHRAAMKTRRVKAHRAHVRG